MGALTPQNFGFIGEPNDVLVARLGIRQPLSQVAAFLVLGRRGGRVRVVHLDDALEL